MSWVRICRFLLPNILGRWLSTPARLEHAEAIVVLGGGIAPDGTLNNGSLRRAVHGITLHRKGLGPLLVFLGTDNTDGPSEAEVRAELARQMGISPERILTEAGPRTTRKEAVRVEVILRPMGVRRILLVTDSQHMARAQGLFERAGFEVLAAPADDLSSTADAPEERLRLMRRILGEILARIYYQVAGYL
jgi:uncharacterized SAM-binding protein YcdF (DUF218 family)